MKIDKNTVVRNAQIIIDKIDSSLDMESTIIYLAGSIIEGFGNECSDVDVYIIYNPKCTNSFDTFTNNDGITVSNEKCLIHNFIENEVRYDCEYWSIEDFCNAINQLNNINFNAETHIPILSNDIYDLLHRFKTGIPILNINKFKELFSQTKFENLCYYKVVECTSFYSARLEDIRGALISGDVGTAFYLTRMLLNNVVSAYLALNKETNPNEKWLFRKLKRFQETTGDNKLISKYIEFQNILFEESKVEGFVKKVIAYCQEIIIELQNNLNKKQLNS